LRNWPGKFALVCATISLAGEIARAQQEIPIPKAAPSGKSPAIALLDPGEAPQWQSWTKDTGWKIITPTGLAASVPIDERVLKLSEAVQEAVKGPDIDPARIYLAGRAEAAAAVFYTISRIPDLWAAGLALGGSPMQALNTDRIYAANFTNTPVLWVSNGANDPTLAEKLKAAGMNIEWRTANGITNGAVFEWLMQHSRDEFPASIDCETNAPTFGRCYWIQMTRFDAGERNDVLPSTHVSAGNGASLDLGEFAFKLDDPGPGVLVAQLVGKYSGPLKAGDRILEFDGRPIENARQYIAFLSKVTSEKRIVVMIQRGKERQRVETRIIIPVHDPVVTARVQAKYDPETKGVDIVSRTVTEMRVTVPPQWVPANLYWNGLSLEDVTKPGCILLSMDKEILHAAVCQ
jgi:predicted esterase